MALPNTHHGAESERAPSKPVITLQYVDLQNKSLDLSDQLERALGGDGLGIIAIAGIPGYPQLRRNLLPLAERLTNLPEEARKKLEDPGSGYNFGWSCAVETFTGEPDLKASFYANVCNDAPMESEEIMKRYPSQCRHNLWPTEDLPELETAFKALGRLIMEVSFLLAYHCDKYASSKSKTSGSGLLETMLRNSRAHKGRLLHYLPNRVGVTTESYGDWCGWHTDFGSLTGLTCAMYTKGGVETPCPDSESGLYIRSRSGLVVRAVYDEDCLAYQIGETTEMLSGGLFHATPHCVKAPREGLGMGRNTFALFMQPNWNEPLYKTETAGESDEVPSGGSRVVTFGEHSEVTIRKYLLNPVL